MNEKYYQSSNKFSWKGIVVMLLTYLVVGTGLSWVYLWINRVCPSIYLCVFAAVGLAAAVDFIARLVIKVFKLRSVMAVLIGAVVGLAGMHYLKWAIYDYYDYVQIDEQIADYIDDNDYELYADMKKEIAYTYFEMNYDFDESEYTFDENWQFVTETNAYDYYSYYDQMSGTEYLKDFSAAEQAKMKTQTLYEFFSYDTLLGKTKEECQKNLAKAREMTAYEYYYDYLGNDKNEAYEFEVPSFMDIVTDPGLLWSDIKDIAEEGRWSMSSSSSSSSSSSTYTNDEVVKGGMLWFIWIMEFLLISITAIVIPIGKAKEIFIEKDDKWANTYDGNRFTFVGMSKAQVKAMLEQTPDNIANMMIVRPQDVPMGRPYLKMTLSHSDDFTESYLNVLTMSYNAKSRNYVSSDMLKGLKIRPKHVGMLFTMFGLSVPAAVAADQEFIEWDRYRLAQSQAMMNVSAPQANTASGSNSVYLLSDNGNTVETIKEVREATGLGLKEAKELVESAPTTIKAGISMEEAQRIQARLDSVGASSDIR